MPTAEKIRTVEEIADVLKKSSGIYLADFTGLDVPKVTLLRKKLREESVAFRVVKNRLTLLAMKKAGIDGLNDQLLGPTGLVSTEEDATLPARLLAEFAKDAQGKPKMKAGLIDGRLFGEADLEALSKLPGREALLGQVVTAIASPMSGIVFTLNALLAKFVRTLSAVADQRREAGDDAPAPAAEERADDPAAAETGPGASSEAPPEEADAPPAGDVESKPEEAPEASSDDESGEASPSENA